MIEEVMPNGKSPPVIAAERKGGALRAAGEGEPSFREVLARKQSFADEPRKTAAEPHEPESTPKPPTGEKPVEGLDEESGEDTQPEGETAPADPAFTPAVPVTVPVVTAQVSAPGETAPAGEEGQPDCPVSVVVQVVPGADAECAQTGETTASTSPAALVDTAAAVDAPEGGAQFAAALNSVDAAGGAQSGEQAYSAPPASTAVSTPTAAASAVDLPPEIEAARTAAEEPARSAMETRVDTAQAQAAGNSTRVEQQAGIREPVRTAEASSEILQQVAKNVEMAVSHHQTTMRIQLHPHELGSIDIRLISNQNGIGIMVLAEKAATGRLLESQLGQLQQNLASAGIDLAQLLVGQNSPQDPQSSLFASTRQEQGGHRQAHRPGERQSGEPAEPRRKPMQSTIIDYRV